LGSVKATLFLNKEMKTVNSILVAGAGTAGFVAALILKKKLKFRNLRYIQIYTMM
jgi:hypothetical protein